MNVLAELIRELNSGSLQVVDLTQPLSPQTPLLPLPPQWPNRPGSALSWPGCSANRPPRSSP